MLLLFFLFLPWNQKQTIILIEQKMFANKNCYLRNKKSSWIKNCVQSDKINGLYFSCRFSRLFVAFCELAWSCMAFLWSCIAFYGFYYELVWPFYGPIWPFMANYIFDWNCIVLSRGHRSKFICSCFLQRNLNLKDRRI